MGTESKKICKVISKGKSTIQEIKTNHLINYIRRVRDAPRSCQSSREERAYQRPSLEAGVAFDKHISDVVYTRDWRRLRPCANRAGRNMTLSCTSKMLVACFRRMATV